MTTESGEELVTVQEAAKELNVSESAIRNATLEGRLPSIFKYNRKLITRAALDAYKARTQPGGAPVKGRPVGTKKKAEPPADATQIKPE
jgi:excisionase family DNA binding protein